jgi:hypothetical protein
MSAARLLLLGTLFAVCEIGLARNARAQAADLLSLSPGDTCVMRPLQQFGGRSGPIRSVGIARFGAKARSASVGLDSLDRALTFLASTIGSNGTSTRTEAVSALFDTKGHMSQSVRTVTIRDRASGTGRSTTDPLSAADTSRVRALMTEVQRRCGVTPKS